MNYFIKYRINLYSKYKKHINTPNTNTDKTTYAPICWVESSNILINLYIYFYFIVFILIFIFYYMFFRFLLYIFLQCYYNDYRI